MGSLLVAVSVLLPVRVASARWTWKATALTRPVEALAIDPSDPAHLLAAVFRDDSETFGSDVVESRDAGEHWQPLSTITGEFVFDLEVAPGGAGIAYAIVNLADFPVNYVVASLDGGRTWSPGFDTVPYQVVPFIVADPVVPETVYSGLRGGYANAAGAGCVTKSTDAGRTWTFGGPGCDRAVGSVLALAVAPSSPNVVYLQAATGMYRSDDAAIVWNLVSPADSPAQVLAADAQNPEIVYAATGTGIARTTDGGEHWAATSLAGSFWVLKADADRPGTIFAAGGSTGFVSSDHGGTWTPLPRVAGGIYGLAVKAGHVYAGSDGGVLELIDVRVSPVPGRNAPVVHRELPLSP